METFREDLGDYIFARNYSGIKVYRYVWHPFFKNILIIRNKSTLYI